MPCVPSCKNMFTSGSRSYSGLILSLVRRNLHKNHVSSRGALLFFIDCFLTDRANELTRGILRKGCWARVLLFLVNWGYNSREKKSQNPFPSFVQLLTSPDCLVIDLDSITNNSMPYEVNLVTVVEGNLKAPFSIATTLSYSGGCYSFPRIAPLYPWSIPYNAGC